MNTILAISGHLVFAIGAVLAFLSFISFIQIGSAASDENKKLKAMWWILGFVFLIAAAGVFYYLKTNSN